MNMPYKIAVSMLAGYCCLFAAGIASAFSPPFAEAIDKAAQCGVSQEAIGRVTGAVEDREISEADGEKLLFPVLEACGDKLPLAPFEDKLNEGLAKRVAPARIAMVLAGKLDAYRFVRGLLASRTKVVDPELLVVMGEGVSRAVPRVDIEAYIAEFAGQPPSRFLTGAHMVCLLGQSGFAYTSTRSMLEEAFVNNGPADEWRYFIRVALVARQRGLDYADVAEAARLVLRSGGALSDVSSRLGFTSRSLRGRPGIK